MILVEGDKEIRVNTVSNWPLIEDLFVKWGYGLEALDDAKTQAHSKLKVSKIDDISAELSAWGIPWKRNY